MYQVESRLICCVRSVKILNAQDFDITECYVNMRRTSEYSRMVYVVDLRLDKLGLSAP